MNERQALLAQTHGKNSHVGLLPALEGLTPQVAGKRVPGAVHTIFQILQHMVYWQDIALARLRQQPPEPPKSAALGWQAPAAPENESDWDATVSRFAEGLRGMTELLTDPGVDLGTIVDGKRGTSVREEVLMIQGHNSYHLGQIVSLRQQLGTWPPPRGGDTW